MRSPHEQQNTLGGPRRLLGAFGLLLFVSAFFVMPLCSGLAVCSMPCCHQGNASGAPSLVSTDISACEADCMTRATDAPSIAVLSSLPEKGVERNLPLSVAAAIVVVDAPLGTATLDHGARGSTRSEASPLHLLNSTFRI